MIALDNSLFENAWEGLSRVHGPTLAQRMPKRMIWLNGAPGAGKGTHTQLILDLFKVQPQPIVISDLLHTPEARAIIDSGKLVGDEEVTRLLFEKIMEPAYKEGVVIDGYPRSLPQARCIQSFESILNQALASQGFNACEFHVLVLNVTENVSIARQLHRGQEALQNPSEQLPRATDLDPEKALRRYQVFQESTYVALQSLKGYLPYTEIDATGTIESVQSALRNAFP
jgi:adenylate kinase